LNVPFLTLSRESERAREEFEGAFRRVTERGHYVLGPELEAFEAEFAAWLGVRHAVGVGSGTDAIALALEASRAVTPRADCEVLTPALSAAFTALAIHRAGAVPRFVDVDPATLQIDPGRLERAISPRARAIVPVHLYGNACDIAAVCEAARARGLAVIEDACQAHGSRLAGRALGAFGAAGCFSFYPTKNLGALGDGGLVATDDEELARRARKLRHGGQSRTYCHELLGINSRLDELQAALLRSKLARLEARNRRRRELAARYDQALSDLPLRPVPPPEGCESNRHLYVARARSGAERDQLRAHLRDRGIETLVHYPLPLPLQPALRPFVLAGEEFPAAEAAAREVVSLPLYPELGDDELAAVVEGVLSFFGRA
jgi:dTDP-3-amino-3,4,6-trideoxy-alpha-D-glucose transaminase